jgi:hypothetical protein
MINNITKLGAYAHAFFVLIKQHTKKQRERKRERKRKRDDSLGE